MKLRSPYWTVLALLAGCADGLQQDTPVLTVPSGWESGFVDGGALPIHYWRTGGNAKPVMVMAHGITDYGLNWTSLAERLQGDYDIIMYDARGHGFSEKPDGPYDLDAHVEDLAGLVRALALEKPILIGHSMGGATVALTAAAYPELPRAIILEDPADMLAQLDPLTEDHAPQWKKLIQDDKALGKERLKELARTSRHPGWPDVEYDRWATSKLLVSPNVVDILGGRGFGNALETYPKITVPVLILKADADKESRQKHLEIASVLPRGRLVHVPGAGHLIRLDRPAETERLIRTFLAELN